MSFKTVYSCNVKHYQNETFLILSNKSITMWHFSVCWGKKPHHPKPPAYDLIKNHRTSKLHTLHIFNFSASIIFWYFSSFFKVWNQSIDNCCCSFSVFIWKFYFSNISQGSVGLLSPFSCSSMESKLLGAVSIGERCWK